MVKTKNIELNKAFGNHLRELRVQQNLSQEELANGANIPISQIGRIERGEGNPTISTLFQIASTLKIELKELLFFNYSE